LSGQEITGIEGSEGLREREFRAAFEMAAVGMAQADPHSGELLRVNRKFCEITGYAEAELLGRSFADITHPDDRAANFAGFQRFVRGETPEFIEEKRYVRPDGGAVWVRVQASLVRDAEERPLRTVAVIEDITERKRAEERERQLLRERIGREEAEAGR
jgi:PAS domain S-box-containing protein